MKQIMSKGQDIPVATQKISVTRFCQKKVKIDCLMMQKGRLVEGPYC